MRDATSQEILSLLRERPSEIESLFPEADAHLSFPVDGKGARIQASVRPEDTAKMPKEVEVLLAGERIRIPVEVTGDYEDHELL